MREILFRAKRVVNGQWVIGNLSTYSDGSISIRSWYCGKYNAYSVAERTVGQYTGLTDKNGVKIFEGDIVEVSYGNETQRYEVKYNGTGARFILCNKTLGSAGFADLLQAVTTEVIGNIHDNPELMGVQE